MELVIHSKSSDRRFPLGSDGAWTVGRHPDNDIIVDDLRASRHHGRFSLQDGALYFEDLGTGNGTRISGVSVPPNTEIEIQPADTVEIGEFKIVLSDTEDTGAKYSTFPQEGQTGFLYDRSTPDQHSIYPLGKEPVLIGRLPMCHIPIDDPGSSRINTEIILEGSGYCIRDLGSSNGTYLNEKKISKELLTPGDVIRIGKRKFEFTIEEESVGTNDSQPGTPVPVTGKLSPGCNMAIFGLIIAILSGTGVYLFVAQSGSPIEQVQSGNPATSQVQSSILAESVPVIVDHPLITSVSRSLLETGNVQLARRDIIPFPLGRKVAQIHVENRQQVKQGTPLVTFELTDDLQSKKKQATAALNLAREEVAKAESEVAKADAVLGSAKNNLSIIEDTHERSRPVYQNGNLLQKEWDEIRMKLAEAEAAVTLRAEEKNQAKRSVTQARERVNQAQTDFNDVVRMIEDLTIKANSEGVVNRLDLKEGYTVTTVNSSMEIIDFESEVLIVVSVSEDDIVSIRQGSEVDVWLPRDPDNVFRGSVSFISPTAVNRNYDVELKVANQNSHFRPGQQASVRFYSQDSEKGTLVPFSALSSDNQAGYFLFTVDTETLVARKIPVRRIQETTYRGSRLVQVATSHDDPELTESDLIVIKGTKALRNGTKVTIQNGSPPTESVQ